MSHCIKKSIAFVGLIVAALLFVSSNSIAFAVSEPEIDAVAPPQSQNLLPQVSIEDVVIDKGVYNAGDEITGTFKMTNRSDTLADGLYYSVSLVGNYQKNTLAGSLYDTSIEKSPLTFRAGEARVIPFKYKLPLFVGESGLGIQVSAFASNNFALGWGDSRLFTIKNALAGLFIYKTSISTNDGSRFDLGEGPTIKKEAKYSLASFNIALMNPTKEIVEVTPRIVFYNQFDMEKSVGMIEGKLIKAMPGIPSEMQKIDLPTFEYKPGVYVGIVDFFDKEGRKRSQTATMRYIVGGDIATIHTFTSKKESIREGELLDVEVVYTGGPIDIIASREESYKPENLILDLKMDIFNEEDALVASYSTTTSSIGINTIGLGIQAKTDATALRGVATLSKDGRVLYEKEAVFSPNYQELHDKAAARPFYLKLLNGKTGLIIFALLVLIIISVLIYFKYKKSALLLSLVLLLIVGAKFVYSPMKVSGYTQTAYSGNNGASLYINTPLDNQVMQPGQAYNFTGGTSATACYNFPSYINVYANPVSAFPHPANSQDKSGTFNYVDGSCAWYRGCQNAPNYSANKQFALIGFTADASPGTGKKLYFYVHYDNAGYWSNEYGYVPYSVDSVACGSAQGKFYSYPPTSDLCSNGTPGPLYFTGTYRWDCAGQYGGSDSCEAFYSPPPLCGSAANGTYKYPAPSNNLCSPGTPSIVATSTTDSPLGTHYEWTCTNTQTGSINNCSAPIDQTARCGSAVDTTFAPGKQIGDTITNACNVPYSPSTSALVDSFSSSEIGWHCGSALCSAAQDACASTEQYCPTDNSCFDPEEDSQSLCYTAHPVSTVTINTPKIINYNNSCPISWALNDFNPNTRCKIYNISKQTDTDITPSASGIWASPALKTDTSYKMECWQVNPVTGAEVGGSRKSSNEEVCRINFSSGEFN